MAVTDSKGVYENPNNRGFATILQKAEQGSPFDSMLRVAGRKAAAKQKEQEDVMDSLEAGDVWAPYAEAANQMLSEGIDMFAQGKLDRAGAMKLAVEYKTAQDQAKGLQESHKSAIEIYNKDEEVNEGYAQEWRFKEAVGDGTVDYLSKEVMKGVDDFGFLKQWGGSEGLNENKVVTNLITDLRTTLQESLGEESRAYVGPGAVRYTRKKTESLINQAFTIARDDQGNETVKVKDVETLRREGLLDSFLDNPRFNRIVMDSLYKESNGTRTNFRDDEIDDKAVELINIYGADQQELRVTEDSQNARFSTGGARKGKGDNVDAQESMTQWYRDLRSGEKILTENALQYLKDETLTGEDFLKIGAVDWGDKSYLKNLRGTLFDVTSAGVDANGTPYVMAIPNKDWRGGGYPTPKVIKKDKEMKIPINVNASDAPEFWNTFYMDSYDSKKTHYNESKGANLNTATPNPSPTSTPNNQNYDPNDPI